MTLQIQQRVLGPRHRDTLRSESYLAAVQADLGHPAQAERLARDTLDTDRKVLGSLSHEGRYPEAEKAFQQAIAAAQKANQPGVLSSVWYSFAGGAAVTGHKEEALLYLGKAIDLGLTGPDRIAADSDLESLHPDPRFTALVEKAREAANHP